MLKEYIDCMFCVWWVEVACIEQVSGRDFSKVTVSVPWQIMLSVSLPRYEEIMNKLVNVDGFLRFLNTILCFNIPVDLKFNIYTVLLLLISQMALESISHSRFNNLKSPYSRGNSMPTVS